MDRLARITDLQFSVERIFPGEQIRFRHLPCNKRGVEINNYNKTFKCNGTFFNC